MTKKQGCKSKIVNISNRTLQVTYIPLNCLRILNEHTNKYLNITID